jgi:hypothetical protein
MSNNFTYSILYYVHSQFLQERVNVGILFYFPTHDKIIFKYPKVYTRVRGLYTDLEEWQLKTNLKAIEEKINKLNEKANDLFIESKIEKIINGEVLKKDATVLAFSDLKYASIYSHDYSSIAQDYYDLYFSNYIDGIVKREKHDEAYLLHDFKNKLSSKNLNVYQNYLRKDVRLKAPKTELKFDYKWKNGVENLVKTIGFDLEEESSINIKAIQLWGQLNILSEEIKKKNYKIDLIVSSPEKRNNKLSKAYKTAIDIIKDAKIEKEIVEEEEVDDYVNTLLKQIKPPIPESELEHPNE